VRLLCLEILVPIIVLLLRVAIAFLSGGGRIVATNLAVKVLFIFRRSKRVVGVLLLEVVK
jgi:hypothetical protein